MKSHQFNNAIMIGLAIATLWGLLIGATILKDYQDQQRLIDKIDAINQKVK